MKYKQLATLMTILMLSVPIIGFWHPPPPPPDEKPPCTYMGTLINGNYTWAFVEPADGFCENFVVTVYIANVTDMYGYEFEVWFSSTYFNLVSWTVATNIFTPNQFIIFNGTIPQETQLGMHISRSLPPYPHHQEYQATSCLQPSRST